MEYILNTQIQHLEESLFLSTIHTQPQKESNVQQELDTKSDERKAEYGYDDTLNTYRDKINDIDINEWKRARWIVNIYDFKIFAPIINRAFYKYWEIINKYDVFKDFNIDNDIVLHLAEAPGGFIQSSRLYMNKFLHSTTEHTELDDDGFQTMKKKKHHKHDTRYNNIYTMSLIRDTDRIYNEQVYKYNTNILTGVDNTGNINNLDNIDDILVQSKGKLFKIITADGGFDEGVDYNNKEQLHYYLVLNEIYSAIKLQSSGGTFVIKLFDILTDTNVELLYLLSCVYSYIRVFKPYTSRPTNSEKYIVCMGMTDDFALRETILGNIRKMSLALAEAFTSTNDDYIPFSILYIGRVPQEFKDKIKDMNEKFQHRQYSFLCNAINMCKNGFKNISKNNILTQKREDIYRKWARSNKLDKVVRID